MSATAYSSAVLVSAAGFAVWPHLFTKAYAASPRVIRRTVLAYPLFAVMLVPVLFIGLAGVGIVPPDTLGRPDRILPHLVTRELQLDGALLGLIGAAALAAAMSSADGITHGASVSIGRDVVRPLFPDLTERTQMRVMRAGGLAAGAGAFVLATTGGHGLVELLLGAYGAVVQFAPAVYGALFWPRASRSGALSGLVAGVAVNVWYQLAAPGTAPWDLHPGLLGLAVNLALFVPPSLGAGRRRASGSAGSTP